jgi:integrase
VDSGACGSPASSSLPHQVTAVADNPWLALASAYLRARRRRASISQVSHAVYRSVLGRLAAGLAAAAVPTDAPSDTLLEAIETWMERSGWSAPTRCTNLGIIRPFLEWAAAGGDIHGGVASRLRNPRRPKPLPRALKAHHVAGLLTHVPDTRGMVIVLLESQCGLRRAEVAAIRWPGDVDLIDGTILVRGKGGVERMVYPSPETVDALHHWLGQRGTAPGALVCAFDNPRHLTPTWIGILVGRWMEDAGLKHLPRDGVSGHALRHTAATTMLRNGTNVRVVQEAMGHASLATTARYLRADNDEVRAAMAGLSYGPRHLRAVE